MTVEIPVIEIVFFSKTKQLQKTLGRVKEKMMVLVSLVILVPEDQEKPVAPAYSLIGGRQKCSSQRSMETNLKCYCDKILDIHFFTFSCTIGFSYM